MSKVKFRDYNPLNYIKTEADLEAYVQAAVEDKDKRIAELEAALEEITDRYIAPDERDEMTCLIEQAQALLTKATP